MAITPGVLPLSTDFDAPISDMTLRDLVDIIDKLVEDHQEQENFISKGEVTAENNLDVQGDIQLSPKAVSTLKEYLGIP